MVIFHSFFYVYPLKMVVSPFSSAARWIFRCNRALGGGVGLGAWRFCRWKIRWKIPWKNPPCWPSCWWLGMVFICFLYYVFLKTRFMTGLMLCIWMENHWKSTMFLPSTLQPTLPAETALVLDSSSPRAQWPWPTPKSARWQRLTAPQMNRWSKSWISYLLNQTHPNSLFLFHIPSLDHPMAHPMACK